MGVKTWDQIGADRLADEVAVLVRRGVLDSRSAAADALLDYRNPPSGQRAERLAELEALLDDAVAMLTRYHHPFGHDYIRDEKRCTDCRAIKSLADRRRNPPFVRAPEEP